MNRPPRPLPAIRTVHPAGRIGARPAAGKRVPAPPRDAREHAGAPPPAAGAVSDRAA